MSSFANLIEAASQASQASHAHPLTLLIEAARKIEALQASDGDFASKRRQACEELRAKPPQLGRKALEELARDVSRAEIGTARIAQGCFVAEALALKGGLEKHNPTAGEVKVLLSVFAAWGWYMTVCMRFVRPDGTVDPSVDTRAADLWALLLSTSKDGNYVRALLKTVPNGSARQVRLLEKKNRVMDRLEGLVCGTVSPGVMAAAAPLIDAALARIIKA